MGGAGGALPPALRLAGDGRTEAVHVVAQVTGVTEQHLVLNIKYYKTPPVYSQNKLVRKAFLVEGFKKWGL